MTRLSPKEMPANTDGRVHLFFAGDDRIQFMAVSTTGCIAAQQPDSPIQVFHWYFRAKGNELITLPLSPWLILWSCRAPWNTERAGHITRLQINEARLTSIDVRELNHLGRLECRSNALERLDCSGLSHLRSLDCSGNELIEVNVDGCCQLRQLKVGGNPRLRESASELLARARGEPVPIRQPRLTATSLFDL